jgi:acetyl-CoA C-acetyltransferase
MYRNGSKNPLAHVQNGPQTAAEILALPESGKGSNMVIAAPLRLHDCSLVTDGAAALVLTSTENAKATRKKVVEIAGIGHSEEYMPLSQRANKHVLEAGKDAVAKAYKGPAVHRQWTSTSLRSTTCFTYQPDPHHRGAGHLRRRQGRPGLRRRRFTADDEQVCVNLSGGLKAKGHRWARPGASCPCSSTSS